MKPYTAPGAAPVPAPGFLPTPSGLVDLAEAQALAGTFGCDLGRAVSELEARELDRLTSLEVS